MIEPRTPKPPADLNLDKCISHLEHLSNILIPYAGWNPDRRTLERRYAKLSVFKVHEDFSKYYDEYAATFDRLQRDYLKRKVFKCNWIGHLPRRWWNPRSAGASRTRSTLDWMRIQPVEVGRLFVDLESPSAFRSNLPLTAPIRCPVLCKRCVAKFLTVIRLLIGRIQASRLASWDNLSSNAQRIVRHYMKHPEDAQQPLLGREILERVGLHYHDAKHKRALPELVKGNVLAHGRNTRKGYRFLRPPRDCPPA